MPYSAEHKQQTRARIVEAARILFNRHGFNGVSIDMLMQEVGMTRGGFYNHFKSKEELFSEAVRCFLNGRGAEWRKGAGVDVSNLQPEMAKQMVNAYLSPEHLGDLDGQCPMIALPSDIARGGLEAQEAFQSLLKAMVWLLEANMDADEASSRETAQAVSALCIGGMVVARAMPSFELAQDVRKAARVAAVRMLEDKMPA